MLKAHESQRTQDEDQEQLGPSDSATHEMEYPFIAEFSELLRKVSTDVLKSRLLTYQQRLLAESIWAAENYGGSEAKCAKHLKEIYGPKWYEMTSISSHMDDVRDYYELVLILDHQEQWKAQKKLAKLSETNGTKCPPQKN